MIAFRHTDPRFPFLRKDVPQPAGRWNAPGQLTHYFSDTPDGAWAEFLRHEEIVDPADLSTVRRALWAVDIGDEPLVSPDLPQDSLTGGPSSWSACQRWASSCGTGVWMRFQRPRPRSNTAVRTAGRWMEVSSPGPARDGQVFALFGPRPTWSAGQRQWMDVPVKNFWPRASFLTIGIECIPRARKSRSAAFLGDISGHLPRFLSGWRSPVRFLGLVAFRHLGYQCLQVESAPDPCCGFDDDPSFCTNTFTSSPT